MSLILGVFELLSLYLRVTVKTHYEKNDPVNYFEAYSRDGKKEYFMLFFDSFYL
jgi:hypothetical protein